MPAWYSIASLPPWSVVLLAGLAGFLFAVVLFLWRRRKEASRAWEMEASLYPEKVPLGDEDGLSEHFPDVPLRPVPPNHPTPAESHIWERTYQRLQEILGFSRGDTKSLRMIVWYPLPGRRRWRARLGYNLKIEDLHFVLNLEEHPHLTEWLLEREQPFSFPLNANAALRSWAALESCRSGLWVPIRYFHQVDRLVLLVHTGHGYFHVQRVRLATLALAIATLEGVRLWYEGLLQRIKAQWVRWEKQLYRRLARQLHDGPAQTVAAIAMEAGFLRMQSKRDPQAALANLKRLEEMAREAASEIRHLLFILRPVILEEEGLAAALHDLAAKMKRLYRQQVILELSPEVLERVHPTVQTLLFYIAVEGLNNAAKHAQADTVWVRLRPDPRGERLILEIEDNGRGFDPQQVFQSYARRESLGLLTLRERVRRMGGRLEIHSAPGQGTRLVVYAPYVLQPEDELTEEAEADEDAVGSSASETPASSAATDEGQAAASSEEEPPAASS